MLEIAGELLEALAHGHRVAVATVTRVLGSAPRTLGTAMAVTDAGAVIGSISGGCVEGAIFESAQEVLSDGRGRLTEFGVTDDDAFAVGLSCGGTVEVFLTEFAPAGRRNALAGAARAQLARATAGRAAGLALVVSGAGAGRILVPNGPAGPGTDGDAGSLEDAGAAADGPDAAGAALKVDDSDAAEAGLDPDAERRIRAELDARITRGETDLGTVDCDGVQSRVLYLVAATPPRCLIFGAVDFAAALSAAASLLGYRVTVCDARAVFATPERFPAAAEVVVEWPSDYLARTDTDARTVVCVLTHDEKFDLPLLETALGLDVAYVGAMGSRRSHDRRMLRLREAGVAEPDLARLHSPIGLDLGASSPEETAVSIVAEILAARSGATGLPLRDLPGPIHPVS
ncbi:XdhC family protein [Cryobacterium sp. PAMC25264]|uniref:XdhC family protein n=1 Tax=Cryobacterium sp. PAMC25264 TaxID=2861288 RepID=UPI001C62AF2F|nr:XdhC/CoxI family protein [Cryobacterium sp. PAMC25264]QYF74628.1 XdhC family protein [Cryobacterium sp. PAMC25264]